MLEGKTAVIYGGAGVVGSAIAKELIAEGARVVLAGRTGEKVAATASWLGAEYAVVDANDRDAVEAHARTLGRIDISVNAIGFYSGDRGIPLVDLSIDDFSAPIAGYTRANFVTATVAARIMAEQGDGVIVTLSNAAAADASSAGGFGIACAAVESLSLQLAAELDGSGVRIVCIRPDDMPETALLGSFTRRLWRNAAGSGSLDERLELAQGPRLATVTERVVAVASGERAAVVVPITG